MNYCRQYTFDLENVNKVVGVYIHSLVLFLVRLMDFFFFFLSDCKEKPIIRGLSLYVILFSVVLVVVRGICDYRGSP